MRSRTLIVVAALLAAVTVAQARSYLLLGRGNKLPAKIDAAVAAAGGTVTSTNPEIGLAVIESSAANFAERAARISGVQAVVPNVLWRTSLPQVAEAFVEIDDATPATHTSGFGDSLSFLQWNLHAVEAEGAWAAGHRGAGVRVAVLDSGVASGHVDIAPNLNTTLSTSFVPGEAYNFTGNGFNHGTHVAGIIAAASNGVGTVGVAPQAEIVAVKVLSAVTGSGAFGGIINGIIYAANIDADVINMSLGTVLPRHGFVDDNGTPADLSDDVKVGAQEITALANALNRATTYAYQRGSTVIVAAGNDGIDRDHDADTLVLPADCPHVISVSATGPFGWAVDSAGSPDFLASYSNHGQSRIDFAAPGGDFAWPNEDLANVGGIVRPIWVFDMVFAPVNRIGASNFNGWAAGTSMAAPHVSAIAALIIGRNGGPMKPSAVEAALRASADDLGKPGNDEAYGAGRVNAATAATQ